MSTQLPERLISDWLAGGYRPRTVKRYTASITAWQFWCQANDIDPMSATRPDIERYATQLEQAGQPATTRYASLCAIRGLYRFAHEEGWTPSDPGAHVRMPARPRESNGVWLTADEARHMGETADRHPDPRAGAVYWTLLLTGIRNMELVNTNVTDLEDYGETRTLRVTRKTVAHETYTQRIQLPGHSDTAIRRMLGTRDSGPLFLSNTGNRISQDGVNRLLRNLTSRTGISKHVTAHAMRRTFATLALDAGVPPRDIMASGNWTAEQMLRFYDRERAAVDRHAGISLAAWLDNA